VSVMEHDYHRPMPRPRTGSLRRRATRLGTSYSLRVSYRGKEVYHYIGGSWEGWTEERVEAERQYVLAQVRRGEYVPQRRETAPSDQEAGVPTFQVLASALLDRQRRRVSVATAEDLEWRFSTAMDHFGSLLVSEIDEATADDFVDEKLREREAIEQAAAAGAPIMETYVDSRNRKTYRRRRRSLSINKVLAAVRRVLKEAKRRRYIEFNPLDDSDCFLDEATPSRSYLEPPQIVAVVDAAQELDAEERKLEWRDVREIRKSNDGASALGRRFGVSETLIRRIRRNETWTSDRPREARRLPMVQTLLLGGPRVLEACKLDRPDLDLASRVIRVSRVKTDASERMVPMVPALHETLLVHRADLPEIEEPAAFPTREGTRQSPDNVRARILASVRVRANELLAARGERPIGHLTPHTLRRTFASILAEVGVAPRRAMYLLGHTDPRFTMRVYEQVFDAGPHTVAQLETVLGCSLEEAFAAYSGRQVSGPKPDSAQKTPRGAVGGGRSNKRQAAS
jgi:integrase